MERSTLT